MKSAIKIITILLFPLVTFANQSCDILLNEGAGLAHARVALMGSHTDYNLGWTLASLLKVKTEAVVRRRTDGVIRVTSGGQEVSYKIGTEKAEDHWSDYIKGITLALAEKGMVLPGADISITSDIPSGSGISSSAALVTAVFKALRATYKLPIDDMDIAKLAQRVEKFAGAETGLLDQMVISLLGEDTSSGLVINHNNQNYHKVKIPDSADLVVIFSGMKHSNKDDHGDRNYKTRRKECETVCAKLGIENLSVLTIEQLEAKKSQLSETEYRRARHIVSENNRFHSFIQAMEKGDPAAMGRLMNESHISQKDDYDISEPAINLLVGLLQNQPNVYGAQLTGGGFGGTVVFLARKGTGAAVAKAVAAQYLANPINGGRYQPVIIGTGN